MGLKNLDKSESILVDSVTNVEELVAKLCCRKKDPLTIYLDLPLRAPYKSRVG